MLNCCIIGRSRIDLVRTSDIDFTNPGEGGDARKLQIPVDQLPIVYLRRPKDPADLRFLFQTPARGPAPR